MKLYDHNGRELAPALQKPRRHYHLDSDSYGWYNPTNDFGIRDPNFGTYFLPDLQLGFSQLGSLFTSDALSEKAVCLKADDATRKGADLISKKDTKAATELQDILEREFDWMELLHQWIIQARLYGGASIFANIDGQFAEDPMDEERIKKINYFRVVNRFRCFERGGGGIGGNEPYAYYPLNHPKEGQAIHYYVTIYSPERSEQMTVHESRLMRLTPKKQPDYVLERKYLGWGPSVLQVMYNVIKRYGVSVQSSSALLQSFVEEVFKLANIDIIEDQAKLQAFIAQQRQSRSLHKATVIDAESELQKIAQPTTGMSEIHEAVIMKDIAMATGYPLSILFSNESGNLGGNTITGDRITYYDGVRTDQKTKYTFAAYQIVKMVGIERGIPTDDIEVEWNPLHELSETEEIDNRYTQAQTDQIYEQMGAPGIDILKSRFSGNVPDLDHMEIDFKELEAFHDEQQDREVTEHEERVKQAQLTTDRMENDQTNEPEQDNPGKSDSPKS